MFGALIGSIAGSTRESREWKVESYDFPLIEQGAHMTDDSILALAVADGAMRGLNDVKRSYDEVARSLRLYARAHPDRGYGRAFREWMQSDDAPPYASAGNGAAMRAAPIAWLYGTLEEVETFAMVSAMPTHSHPEGLRGARAAAGAAFLALDGASMSEIESYLTGRCGYALPASVEELRATHSFDVSSAATVPAAARCFLSSESFEQAIRSAIYIGGDTDTQAAIAGAMAEARWGVPQEIADDALRAIDSDRVPGLRTDIMTRITAVRHARALLRGQMPPADLAAASR